MKKKQLILLLVILVIVGLFLIYFLEGQYHIKRDSDKTSDENIYLDREDINDDERLKSAGVLYKKFGETIERRSHNLDQFEEEDEEEDNEPYQIQDQGNQTEIEKMIYVLESGIDDKNRDYVLEKRVRDDGDASIENRGYTGITISNTICGKTYCMVEMSFQSSESVKQLADDEPKDRPWGDKKIFGMINRRDGKIYSKTFIPVDGNVLPLPEHYLN